MRTRSEPLEQARWCDVGWNRKVLALRREGRQSATFRCHPKTWKRWSSCGSSAKESDERVVRITYGSLKAAWKRACERAGFAGLNLYDLRHGGDKVGSEVRKHLPWSSTYGTQDVGDADPVRERQGR